MNWWLVVLGISLMAFASGLTVGMWLPRSNTLDTFLNYLMLFVIMFSSMGGMICAAYGLQR